MVLACVVVLACVMVLACAMVLAYVIVLWHYGVSLSDYKSREAQSQMPSICILLVS